MIMLIFTAAFSLPLACLFALTVVQRRGAEQEISADTSIYSRYMIYWVVFQVVESNALLYFRLQTRLQFYFYFLPSVLDIEHCLKYIWYARRFGSWLCSRSMSYMSVGSGSTNTTSFTQRHKISHMVLGLVAWGDQEHWMSSSSVPRLIHRCGNVLLRGSGTSRWKWGGAPSCWKMKSAEPSWSWVINRLINISRQLYPLIDFSTEKKGP